MPLAQETDGLSCATTLVPVARIGVPLLLKTILPRPAVAMGALTGRIFFSIAVQKAARNEHRGRCHLVHIVHRVKRQRKSISLIEGFERYRLVSEASRSGSVQPNGGGVPLIDRLESVVDVFRQINILPGNGQKWQWSEFLVQLRFWGFLHGVLMVNLEPLSGCAVKTAHIPESKIEEDVL